MPDGQPIPEMELLAPSEAYDHMRATAAIWIEKWLNEVGIPVKANLTSIDEIVQKALRERDFDMYIFGFSLPPFPSYMADLFHSQGGFNAGGYQNPEFDAKAEAFLAETDLNEAQRKAFELQEIIADELPMVALLNVPILEAYQADLVKWAFTEVLNGVQAYFPSMNGPLSYTPVE